MEPPRCRLTPIVLAALLSTLLGSLRVAEGRVLLIVVDGLDAREITPEVTPILARAWQSASWCPGIRGVASMPTRTNSNHATLVTGVEPEAHGITGNAVWDRRTGRVRKLGRAADLQTETIFTIARRANRGLRTAAAVGKPKLGAMFAGDDAHQVPPDELWDASTASDSARDEITRYAYDGTTLAAARALVEHAGADFVLVNLADVDRVSHGYGPQAQQAVETRRRTDAALGTFLEWLTTRPDWSTTTVIVTADHGFDAIREKPVRFAEVLAAADLRGLEVVGEGGTAHVYLTRPSNPSRDAATLAAARRVALGQPSIAEVLYVRSNPADSDTRYTLGAIHPDWHLGHERTGDLLLVTKPGFQIVDGSREEAKLLGNHGGPAERMVPVIAVGGATTSEPSGCEDVTSADIGRTVQACLGLPETRRLDGRPIAPGARGRVLPGICPPVAVVTPPVTVP